MSTLPEERSQVAVLEDITADELNGLERAASHTVERHVQGWRDRLATAGADDTVLGAVDDYIRLTDRSRVGVRRLLLEHDAIARTAIVFLWGASRGRNLELSVMREPRSGGLPPAFEASDDPRRAAHEFLWDGGVGRDESEEEHLSPRAAFEKLWCRPNTSKGLLPGCGTAFGTKVLYWAWRCRAGFEAPSQSRPAPLTYDLRVFASLRALGVVYLSDAGEEVPFTSPTVAVPFRMYEAYCELALEWADRLNGLAASNAVSDPDRAFTPDDVELMLFTAHGRGLTSPGPGVGGPSLSSTLRVLRALAGS